MNSKEKRSSGGYGLRRKVVKKKLDEDFEYYSKGAAPQIETSTSAGEAQEKQNDKLHTHLVVVTKVVNPQQKTLVKDSECLEKRPRGRPRKHHLTQKDILDSSSSSTEIRSKNLKSPKVAENVDLAKTNEEKEAVLVSVVPVMKSEQHVEVVDARDAKLGILTADGMTELQEEEVSSLPEGEKENLPEDAINLVTEPDIEEGMTVHMENEEVQDEYDQELTYDYEKVAKGPSVLIMKRKKENLSNEDIQKLNQLNPDDKIECSECHKLLKPSSFRQHLRTHTGEKPFGCDVCEARFTRKGDVERHVRIVHNKQKPFKCSRCQRAFGDKKNLRWHLMNHDKKLFYVCEVCGFKFGKREYWENHVKFIHPAKGVLDSDGDSSMQIEEDSEDNVHSSTATLSTADKASQESTNQTLVRSIQEKKQEAVVSAVPLPLLNQLSVQEGIQVINIKNISNLVKMNFSKKQESALVYGRAVSVVEQDGIEAVVIEVDDPCAEDSTIHSQYAEQPPSNVIHIMKSSKALPVVRIEKNEQQKNHKVVVETQNFKEKAVTNVDDVQCKQAQEESEDKRNAISVQYDCDESAQSSKVMSFMLTDNNASTSDGNSTSVQTLIEALLVAAKGDGQQNHNQST